MGNEKDTPEYWENELNQEIELKAMLVLTESLLKDMAYIERMPDIAGKLYRDMKAEYWVKKETFKTIEDLHLFLDFWNREIGTWDGSAGEHFLGGDER